VSIQKMPALPEVQGSAGPLVDVRGVTLQYRSGHQRVTAVYRISFQIEKSERLVLLGASGCGKSTLLKAVGGYISPA
jgi:NitT/TauT family transport system ATP-binding protein